MGRKRRQGNMTPQKTNKDMIENVMDGRGDELPVANIRRMLIKMVNELKEELKEEIQK
jgi:hypothetical protein